MAHVVFFGDLRGRTLDSEGSIFDTVGVVYRLAVSKVVGGIVIA